MPFKPGESGNKKTQFSKENQPSNRGSNQKAITRFIKEIGDAKAITYNIKITDSNGDKKVKKGRVASTGKNNYELLASLMWIDALQGDKRTRREILDRVEGKPQTFIDLTSAGDPVALTPEKRDERIEELMDMLKSANLKIA
jgi:hypothetical protein